MIIGKSYLGASSVQSIYLGASKIYPKSSFLPETNLVIEYGQDNGYLIPTQTYLDKLNGHIRDIIDFNLWDKFDLEYWMVGDGDMDFKTINIIDPDKYKGTINGGLINTASGIEGDSIDGYVNTNFNPTLGENKYKLENAGRFMYVYKQSSSGTSSRRVLDGLEGYAFRNYTTNIDIVNQRINSTGDFNDVVEFTGLGYTALNVTSDTDVLAYKEENEYVTTATIDLIYNANQIIFAKGATYGDNGLSIYGMGSAITGQDAINHRLSIINNL